MASAIPLGPPCCARGCTKLAQPEGGELYCINCLEDALQQEHQNWQGESTRLLVVGDSHAASFIEVRRQLQSSQVSPALDIEVLVVPGCSAQGLIRMGKSRLGAGEKFMEKIVADKASDRLSVIIIMVGAVDLDYVYYHKLAQTKDRPTLLEQALLSARRLLEFVDTELIGQRRVAATQICLAGVNPPAVKNDDLPSILGSYAKDRELIDIPSFSERVEAAQEYNRILKEGSQARGAKFLSIFETLLDHEKSMIHPEFLRASRLDTHLDERKTAPLYVSELNNIYGKRGAT